MRYAMPANSTMFVRVKQKAIKKDYVIRIIASVQQSCKITNAFYISDLAPTTESEQIMQYIADLAKRYNFANFRIVV